ncbi:hypothetical protein CMEL01_07157 [Colletotrichum melonis]|uniref:Uncharacterized protein n=1 Tax=Colletotrichum melonis TaxID=1209925 RepID=A0AAI9XJ83_9PEZI|nr:hypothetical protein CMEL01_07157 [Colletotrichum melonis]
MCLPGSLRDNRRPSIRQETFGWHDSNGGMAHGSMPIVSPKFKQPSTVDPILPPPKGGIKDCDDLPSGKNAQHRQTSTAETSPARHSLSFDTSSGPLPSLLSASLDLSLLGHLHTSTQRRRTGAFNTNTTSNAATAASTYVSALRQLHKRWPATAMYFLCHIAFCVAYSDWSRRLQESRQRQLKSPTAEKGLVAGGSRPSPVVAQPDGDRGVIGWVFRPPSSPVGRPP